MNRQFPGRDLHPLVTCALVAHQDRVVGQVAMNEEYCFHSSLLFLVCRARTDGHIPLSHGGLDKNRQTDERMATFLPNEMLSSKFRQNWARLIRKIFKVDPLVCPKCRGPMRIVAFIEDDRIIKKILKHLGQGETHNHARPNYNPFRPADVLIYDDTYSQIPSIDYWLEWLTFLLVGQTAYLRSNFRKTPCLTAMNSAMEFGRDHCPVQPRLMDSSNFWIHYISRHRSH